MQPITDPAAAALVLGIFLTVALGLLGWGLNWLFSRQVKAYDERMEAGRRKMDELSTGLVAVREQVIRLEGRMAKAEAEIANDKQGRAAFVQMQHDLGRLIEAVAHLSCGFDDLSDRLNAITDRPPPRRVKRVAAE